MRWYISTRVRVGLALFGASLASVGLFVVGVLRNQSWEFKYLPWNLLLAWVPLALTLWLERILRRKLWSSWQAVAVTFAWVCFLPNSFYIITDVIHLQDVVRVDQLYDVVMFSSFILNGFLLGIISLYLVHGELRWRMRNRNSTLTVALVILAVSFAIYIGRDLRWNSWDILLNPASLLFDVSDRLLSPLAHPEMFSTTLSFFVLIGTMYTSVWYASRALRQQKLPD
ncbi:MAG TPA: DUF1361 domain-containing protein [Candidatus Saccharimonadales bacterium]|nr:DUF1361 domain-containing protein [Candidatus Saccharimonadales bacterium]